MVMLNCKHRRHFWMVAKAGQRDLIDQAADRLGRNRSDFMLEAACKQAEDVLLDQICFALDVKRFAAVQTMLDKPPAPTDRLRRTAKARASARRG